VPLGCAGGIDVRERADAGATSRTRDAVVEDSHETVLPPCEPTFASIQRNVFDIACSEGTCHGPPTPAWGLILTDGRALDRLVGKASGSCGEFFLVTPGVPAESFLWLKISSDKPPCGERMPFGGKRLPEWSRACIHDWISGLGTRHDASIDSARRD
jgi:hypothetical protein